MHTDSCKSTIHNVSNSVRSFFVTNYNTFGYKFEEFIFKMTIDRVVCGKVFPCSGIYKMFILSSTEIEHAQQWISSTVCILLLFICVYILMLIFNFGYCSWLDAAVHIRIRSIFIIILIFIFSAIHTLRVGIND